MAHTFPNLENAAEIVERTPPSARVPPDPPFARRIQSLDNRDTPMWASAGFQRERPTFHADARLCENTQHQVLPPEQDHCAINLSQ
jgi:RecB family exonuclease